MIRAFFLLIFLANFVLLTGCSGTPISNYPHYAQTEPMEYPPQPVEMVNGAIYQASHNLALFEDLKARQIGDIVTVLLSESTNAAKSSDTSLDKSNSTSITNPTLAGQIRTIGSNSNSNLGFDLASESGFEAESSSAQSNSLQGSITVTVAKVLPGGNLFVQGEKWININQGSEFIRMRGVIRPVDISANNTIMSTKVADARISYSGTGATADVNAVGWLSRFFMSGLWPF